MPQKPILITAFNPWGGHEDNITRQILEDLKPDLQSRGIDTAVLDVLYSAVDDFATDLKGRNYFNIISLGIMPRSMGVIRFETQARKTRFLPDDTGALPAFNNAAGSAATYKGDPALLALRDHEKLQSYDIGISDNAGAYLCEYVYLRMLEALEAKGEGGAVFIHMANDDFEGKRQFLLDYLDALDSKNIQEPS